MALFQNKWSFLSLNVALSLILFAFISPVYDLQRYINSLFYVSYFYLFFGLIMFVIKGKFLDGITYSFRRVGNRLSKNTDYLDDWESKPMPSEVVSPSVMKMFFFQGTVLTIAMLLLLGYFYQM
ncbi:DUF3899 domain-containing protein [Pontibacillus sp. HMF3514]|uniref:DUF3899 domain-containing protein n=1 Tax=Pontibacillus sp. HMF3514 TaxID=2692425 RepID=UPI00131FE4B6|nr:DUF3899 domain-containing protein [Pontibacillus sp. HMF3514]QHE51455.1 DUF3899 domain-containing protein [Pontibacillus sp. HMF3514]